MKKTNRKQRFIGLPGLKATSCLTVVLLIFLETVLLSTVSNCAKTFFMHWNTSNSIFRIDNTDHIIDVNKGNQAFEYDQVHIICPVYEPGTFDNETEKYIIYNVSKVEYETCRITNANPRIIAICDKPQKLMYFTITFRPFTPQPGGLEFLPGNDYYFISTSSKDDLHRRIGGRCSTNNMKVVFKVCCAPEAESQNVTLSSSSSSAENEHTNSDNKVSQNGIKLNQYPQNSRGTSINTDNNDGRVPTLTINTQSTMTWRTGDNYNGGGRGGSGNGGPSYSTPISSTASVLQPYPHPTSSRPVINKNKPNNIHKTNSNYSNYTPSHKPTKKTNEFDKHPNEVVKNEELTYNNNGGVSLMGLRRQCNSNNPLNKLFGWMLPQLCFILITLSMIVLVNYLSMWHMNAAMHSIDEPSDRTRRIHTTTKSGAAAAATVAPITVPTIELNGHHKRHVNNDFTFDLQTIADTTNNADCRSNDDANEMNIANHYSDDVIYKKCNKTNKKQFDTEDVNSLIKRNSNYKLNDRNSDKNHTTTRTTTTTTTTTTNFNLVNNKTSDCIRRYFSNCNMNEGNCHR